MKRTFVTGEKEKAIVEYKPQYALHDILIPGGQPAKLVKIPDPTHPHLSIQEILTKLKFRNPQPVILLIGTWNKTNMLVGVLWGFFMLF